MKAKSTFALVGSCGSALAVIVAGSVFIQNGGSTLASDPISGKAQLAVKNAKAKEAARVPSDEELAMEVLKLRDQVDQFAKARMHMQDVAQARRAARNAAAARLHALGQAGVLSRKERLSRDAERARLEAERRKYEGTPREVARNLLPDHDWADSQFYCLDKLWTRESHWQVDADNPTSSAYGIPQALPGRRMAAYGSDWRTNPVTQIKWGLDYIEDAYGSPCKAWAHSQATGWY
ncbi:MAG TPA: hypothetical protein VEK80_16575 [Kribbellaceae bacterium]|nr:hypothetical protein [Kribbellaceae bacterium]